MKKIKLIVDTASDLTKEYYQEHDITVMPFGVSIGGQDYLDQENITTEELYSLIEKNGMLPKTAAIGYSTFMDTFSKYLQEYEQILFIGISSHFSSEISNATLASQEFNGRVHVFDSYNLSSGEGLIVIKAAELIEQNKQIDEIIAELKIYAPLVRSQFVIETLDYLYKGGRCSSISYFFGRSLKIKPIIRVVDGKMIVYRKPLGKMKNGLDKLLEIFLEDLPNIELTHVMITHSIGDEYVPYLFDELSKHIDPSIIMITKAGATVSTHCGKGTIGILYALKN
jgi:DegV family protein with EDD domain